MIMGIINLLIKTFLAQPLYFTIVLLGSSFFICVFFKGWPSIPKVISSYLSNYLPDEDNENDDDEDEEENEKSTYTISMDNFKLQIGNQTYRASTEFEISIKKND